MYTVQLELIAKMSARYLKCTGVFSENLCCKRVRILCRRNNEESLIIRTHWGHSLRTPTKDTHWGRTLLTHIEDAYIGRTSRTHTRVSHPDSTLRTHIQEAHRESIFRAHIETSNLGHTFMTPIEDASMLTYHEDAHLKCKSKTHI